MDKEQIIGVDIGTSRCRAVLFETTGCMVAESTRTYPILTPQPGWQEQDPKIVLQAFLECLQEITGKADRKKLAGIGLSGYLNSIMPVDLNGQPLAKCMIWTDTRSKEAARLIDETSDRYALYFHTGCPIHPMYPRCKIRWIRDQHPSTFHQAHKFVSMKEYIVHEVFGDYIVDWSTAGGSGLLNIHSLEWDNEALKLTGLEPRHLSRVASPLACLPRIRPEYATMLGLDDSIPVILGGADGILSNIGVGAVGPHVANNTVGTGGAVRVFVPEPRLDKSVRTWCYPVAPELWAVGGLSAGGLIYEWFIREFAEGERQKAQKRGISLYQLLEEYAQCIPPGSEGLVFLPFLVGSRTPSWNPNARGVLFGLSYHHTTKHFVRALMEGVVYSFFSVFKAVEEASAGIESVRVSGGFVNSPTWMQITADVYGRELIVPSVAETTAFGAMFMVMLALGLTKRMEDVQSMLPDQKLVRPDSRAHETYRELFLKYNRLYEKLEDEFSAIPNVKG